jgi:hypothetical protein
MHSLTPLLSGDWAHHQISPEERETLESWNRHDIIATNDEHYGLLKAKELAKINEGNTGDTDHYTADDGSDTVIPGRTGLTDAQRNRARALEAGETDLDVNAEAARAAEAELNSGPTPVVNDDSDDTPLAEDDAEDDYDTMKNAELRDTLERRGLAKSGNRADLLARLRQHDAEA